MAMVSVVYRQAYGSSRLAWSNVRQPPGAVLHLLRESVSQCFKYDDSIMKIFMVLLIYYYFVRLYMFFNVHLCQVWSVGRMKSTVPLSVLYLALHTQLRTHTCQAAMVRSV